MNTTLQVEQAVNYGVSLKAGKTRGQRQKNTETSMPLVYSERRQAIEINVSDGWAKWGEKSRLATRELLV